MTSTPGMPPLDLTTGNTSDTLSSSATLTPDTTTEDSTDVSAGKEDDPESLNMAVVIGAVCGAMVVVTIIVVVLIIVMRKRRKNVRLKELKQLPKLDRFGLPEDNEPRALQPRSPCPDNDQLTSGHSDDSAGTLDPTYLDPDVRRPKKEGSKRERKRGEPEEATQNGNAESTSFYVNMTPFPDLSSTGTYIEPLNYRPSTSSIPSSPAPAVPPALIHPPAQTAASHQEEEGTFDSIYIPMDLRNPASPCPDGSPLQAGGGFGDFESVYTVPENPLDKPPSACKPKSTIGYVNLPGEERQLQSQLSGNHYQNYSVQANNDYGNVQREDPSPLSPGQSTSRAEVRKSGRQTTPPSSASRGKPPTKPKGRSSPGSSSQSSTPKSSRSGASSSHTPQLKPSPKPSPKPVLSPAQKLHIAMKAKAPSQDSQQDSDDENDYVNAPNKKVEPKSQR